jgi:hypothetical protein
MKGNLMTIDERQPFTFRCRACGTVNEIEPFALARLEDDQNAAIRAQAREEARRDEALKYQDLERQLAEAQAARTKAEQSELRLRAEARGVAELKTNTTLEIERGIAARLPAVVGPFKQQIAELQGKLADAQQTITEAPARWAGDAPKDAVAAELRLACRSDVIEVVAPGRPGSDILQRVRERGIDYGLIALEIKNAKWLPSFIDKAKADQADAGADLAVIVSAKGLPESLGAAGFGNVDGVMVTGIGTYIPVVLLLRARLIEVAQAKAAGINIGDEESAAAYLTSDGFARDVRAMLEAMVAIHKNNALLEGYIGRHRRLQDKLLMRAWRNLARIHGSLQNVLGPKMQPQALLDYNPAEEEDDDE